ncbi:pseudouridine synthase [Aspergillus californicus]
MSLVSVENTVQATPPDPVKEPSKVAVTPCEGLPTRYFFEGGLRRVYPYHYTYNTHCKERWRNRELVDIFISEFRDREPEYYRQALERGQICVNGKPATPSTVLKNGEVVSHTLHRHEPPVTGNDIGIIHESDDLLVIDKPAGVPVHSTGRYHYNSVIEILRTTYESRFIPRPANRLDRLTSGVMFVGKTSKGAEMMTKKLIARTVQKEYVARVKGRFPDGVVVVDQPIMSVSPKVGLNRVRATGKEAKTKFRRMAYYPPPSPVVNTSGAEGEGEVRPATPPTSYANESEGYSIVHCLPLTGRTHQIRVHLQFLGHPISNDPIYSNRRVFGPDLGKNDATPDRDDEIIGQLMKMGRTEVPDTVSYRTHFTTPPLLPPGTNASVVEAIMTKEHEVAVEAYHKRKGERLSGQTCDVCGTDLYTDPGVHELGIFLHAVAYADSLGEWTYRSKMPTWGYPPAGLDGPREVPGWESVPEEEVVIGDGVIPEIGGDDEQNDGVTALVEGVGVVDISAAKKRQEQEHDQEPTAAAGKRT